MHDNEAIPKVDKFNYLNSLLEGTAYKTVQGLPLTESNYDSAVAMLKDRFGDPQQIICTHMEGLMKVANCVNERPSSLRVVFDKIMVHIQGLEALDVTSEQYGSFLIPVIMAKLPNDIRLRIARETGKEVWKIDNVLKIIKQEVEASVTPRQLLCHLESLPQLALLWPAIISPSVCSVKGIIFQLRA